MEDRILEILDHNDELHNEDWKNYLNSLADDPEEFAEAFQFEQYSKEYDEKYGKY